MAPRKHVRLSKWATPIVLPLAVLAALIAIPIVWLFGLGKPAHLTAEEVETYLDDFLNGSGDMWDWDDFVSVSISDPSLDTIRKEAAALELPLSDEGMVKLQALLDQVRLAKGDGAEVSSPSPIPSPPL